MAEPYLILVDVTWRLDMGASISSPSSDKIVIHIIKDGTITNNLTGIQKLLSENKVLTFDNLDQILGKLAVNKVQVTEKYEISITIMFHKIVVTTPTEVETNYNNAIDTTQDMDWEKIGIVSLCGLGRDTYRNCPYWHVTSAGES
ncbi:hypothetical protein A6F53_00845 [Levilactobacillus brevis]|uniref:hypothetical protein n=1 Tax=Levilactobacillus brevis TaxID=1580 RepID=UPI0007F876F3|nr:hypothetical protein [Levilactobacillus brevis]ANN47880.1 hypothetical protein A6F53_00845 [Levilactobacillus brevis]